MCTGKVIRMRSFNRLFRTSLLSGFWEDFYFMVVFKQSIEVAAKPVAKEAGGLRSQSREAIFSRGHPVHPTPRGGFILWVRLPGSSDSLGLYQDSYCQGYSHFTRVFMFLLPTV